MNRVLPALQLPQRRALPHAVPSWVEPGTTFFVTLCCAPRGKNQLCQSAVATAIFESVRRRHESHDWFMRLLVLMPDHLHALIAFPRDREMVRMVRLWKSFLARHAGVYWQRDFFDHRIRNDHEYELKADYIRQNPARAGLVNGAESWPFMWEPS
jgi:putative transposase